MQTWYIGRARGWRVGRAPDDLEILEFALKWRINPREIREEWDLSDIRWLQLVEEAKSLAQPAIDKYLAEKAAKKK